MNFKGNCSDRHISNFFFSAIHINVQTIWAYNVQFKFCDIVSPQHVTTLTPELLDVAVTKFVAMPIVRAKQHCNI